MEINWTQHIIGLVVFALVYALAVFWPELPSWLAVLLFLVLYFLLNIVAMVWDELVLLVRESFQHRKALRELEKEIKRLKK